VQGPIGWQAPFTHAFPAGHVLPQAPQLLVLLSVLVQVPLQQVVPGAVPQSLPQEPQFCTSVVRLVHCGCWGPVQPVAGQELGPTAGQLCEEGAGVGWGWGGAGVEGGGRG
jgi:hypothetical protein